MIHHSLTLSTSLKFPAENARPPNEDGIWLEGGLLIFGNLVEFEFYEKNLGKVKEKQKMWFFAWIALSWKSASHTNGFKCEKLQEA